MGPTKYGSFIGWKSKYISADTAISDIPGIIHAIVVNDISANGQFYIYDSATEAGTIKAGTYFTTSQQSGQVILLDIECQTAIYASFDATLAGHLTVIYK